MLARTLAHTVCLMATTVFANSHIAFIRWNIKKLEFLKGYIHWPQLTVGSCWLINDEKTTLLWFMPS